MRTKKEVYHHDQEDIINTIINILEFNDQKTITLYELDNDLEKQQKIMDLIPNIRKYFSFNNWKAVGEPERFKRPWLSIIRQLTKSKYQMNRKDHRIYTDQEEVIRTILYQFVEL